MKTRILFFSDPRSIHTARWVNHFTDRYTVSLYTHITPSEEDRKRIDPDIQIYHIRKPLGLLDLIKNPPDIIHGHYIAHYGILAAVYHKITGRGKLVLTAWGTDILKGRKGCRKWLTRWAIKQADLITCDAKHMIKALMETGADLEKIKIINFGTDTATYRPRPRDKLPTDTTTTTIISTRLHGPTREKNMELAERLGLRENVQFPGNIPAEEMPERLAKADIYVNTSLSDAGLAASTAEAMATELPVITTDIGDNPKWIEHGKTGYLYSPSNPQDLAKKINKLIEHPCQRIRLGKLSRKVITHRNSHRKEMKKMEAEYGKLEKKV